MATSPDFFEPSESLSARVKPELQPGERLLWAVEVKARPAPGWSFRKQLGCSTILLGFGVLLVLAWLARLGKPGDESVPGFFGFGSIVISLIVLAFAIQGWFNRRRLEQTGFRPTYALTDRRAILWTPSNVYNALPGAIEVCSVFRGNIKTIHRIEYPDGTGDVVFNRYASEEGWMNTSFDGIPDVRRIEDLVRRTLMGQGEIDG